MKKIFVITFLVFSPPIFAEGFKGPLSSEKQGNKENTRWTISDYLMQKQRMGMADMWLAANRSANFFETYIGGGPVKYDLRSTDGSGVTTETSQKSVAYQAALYVSIFGLQAEYEKTDHDMTSMAGALAVRLLGTAHQSTNLTVKYGLQKTEDESVDPSNEWSNQFAEGELTVYVFHAFGIRGSYRHYFADESDTGIELSGHRASAGAFIELGFIRFYGDFFQDKMEADNAGSVTTNEREGLEFGARLYF